MTAPISDLVAAVDFEYDGPTHPSKKARECRDRFGYNLSRHYQLLFWALKDPEVERERPLAVLRLSRRSRDEARGARPGSLTQAVDRHQLRLEKG